MTWHLVQPCARWAELPSLAKTDDGGWFNPVLSKTKEPCGSHLLDSVE